MHDTDDTKVWTQDKWKGIFKVKWIFVRDVPSAALRHIRLIHTPEQKPITNSRDTQELHYEAGCEMLQIFLEFQNKSKTSLLQDFAYYEVSYKFTLASAAANLGHDGEKQGDQAEWTVALGSSIAERYTCRHAAPRLLQSVQYQ